MRMAEHSELHAFVGHENPTILARRRALGRRARGRGRLRPGRRGRLRARPMEIDIAMVSADEPLAAGVVDALLRPGHADRRPDQRRRRDRVEQGLRPRRCWPRWRPRPARCCGSSPTPASSTAAMAAFGERPVAVKPSGLTGGKGVKVMGPHLADHAAAREYALELLETLRRGRVRADRGEDRRAPSSRSRRSATGGPSSSPTRPTTTPTASTGTRARAPAGWARCPWPSPPCPS